MFQFFTEAVAGSMSLFKTKRYLLENIQINKLDIYYSSITAVFLGFLFNFIIFAAGNFIFNDTFTLWMLLFPIILVNLFILVHGIQLIFSTISIYFNDINSIWFVVNTLLFWGTGIFFDLSTLTGKAELIKYFNPLAGILMNARDILIYTRPANLTLLAVNLVTAIFLLVIGLVIFKKYGAKALEKL